MPRPLLLIALLATLTAALSIVACTRSSVRSLAAPDPDPAATPAPIANEPSSTRRVGGDESAAVTREGDTYRVAGVPGLLVDTPLPVGYPAPTPPGAIDLKHYPSVRRAEVEGAINPDFGMSVKFFPLFQHIKRRQIAMTSPVEVDYQGVGAAAGPTPDRWTMSFLYREPANGDTGEDRSVRIVDTEPLTVVAMGIRGRYSFNRLQEPLNQLGRWLDEHPEWERAGDARALYYNGPDRRERDKWAEVQIPVRPAAAR